MLIFESSDKNTISTTTLNYGDHWDFDESIFLKIDRFEGAKPHSPLKYVIEFQIWAPEFEGFWTSGGPLKFYINVI